MEYCQENNIGDYLRVIKKPMDLPTIEVRLHLGPMRTPTHPHALSPQDKLKAHEYREPSMLKEDVQLIVSNAQQYHGADNTVARMAQDLEAHFMAEYLKRKNKFLKRYSKEIKDLKAKSAAQSGAGGAGGVGGGAGSAGAGVRSSGGSAT